MSARVLAHISAAEPWGYVEPESPVDRAAQALTNAVEDLNAAIWQATSRADLILLRDLSERLIQELEQSACVARTLDEKFDEMRGT